MRKPGLDWIKAVLIVMVVVLHVAAATSDYNGGLIRDSFWVVVIDTNVMPLFFVLSGYLLNLKSLGEQSWWETAKRYGSRVVIPWWVAWIYYNYTNEYGMMGSVLRNHEYHRLVWLVLYPVGHLWFVPAFVAVVFLQKFSLAMKMSPLVPAMAIFGGCCALVYLEAPIVGRVGTLWIDLLGDKRLYIVGGYFFVGVWAQRAEIEKWSTRAQGILVAGGVLAVICLGTVQLTPVTSSVALAVAMIGGRSILGLLVIYLFAAKPFPDVRLVRMLSVETLIIYLWHPLVYRSIFEGLPSLLNQYSHALWMHVFVVGVTVGILCGIVVLIRPVGGISLLLGVNGRSARSPALQRGAARQ